jgi:hypothetical protein
MAWFDIVGGLAGGLQQGLSQLQQAQQARQVEARQQELLKIQQAQDIRAEQAAKRQEEQDRLQMFKQLLAGEDPLNVSGQTMGILQQKYADLLPTAIAKNTKTGTFEFKMTEPQRAALVKEREKLAEATHYATLVNTAPEGSLSATKAVEAVRRGGLDASLVSTRVKPSELLSFYTAIFPEKAFESQQALDRALKVEGARTSRAAAAAKEATLTPQAQLNFAVSLQTLAENKVRAAEKMRDDFIKDYGTQPSDQRLAEELRGLQQTVDAARQEAQAFGERMSAFVAQNAALSGVTPLLPSPPSTVGITVTAPDGSKHSFATQAEADRFKQLAGIK